MEAISMTSRLKGEMLDQLTRRMLPYWAEHAVDLANGGFLGQIRQNGVPVPDAAKGSVLNARILWTFAAAYRELGVDAYADLAGRAFDYLQRYFWDPVEGGVFWTVDGSGSPLQTRKQNYAQAFVLYGLSEYFRAVGDPNALTRAVRVFELIEAHFRDDRNGGYIEALGRSWERIPDVRLSERDMNAPKSMNTHLHVLEAYTNLLRVWPDPCLRDRVIELLTLFLERVYDPRTSHLYMFFEVDWTPVSRVISFGHDIEAAWLLLEAADVVGDPGLRERVGRTTVNLARATLNGGLDPDGGLFNESLPQGEVDADKYWWVQAEAVVGFLNAYQETHSLDFLEAAVSTWDFAQAYLADNGFGEWYFRVARSGEAYPGDDKVGMWKCPYHGARACLEVAARVEQIEQART